MPKATSKRRSKAEDFDYFEELLSEAGIKLTTDDDFANIITQEQALVSRDIDLTMKNHPDFPNNITDFIRALKIKICADENNFCKALTNTVLQKTEVDDTSVKQESVFRIFLNVDCLQNQILDILLDQLLTQASEETDDSSFIQLILKSLQFLSFVGEPEQVMRRLLDAIEVGTPATQLVILDHIHEIILDSQYDETSKNLAKLLEDNDNLAGPIIDCMNSFNLSEDAKYNIQEFIIDRLFTSSRYYHIFPILIDFLISNCKPDSMINILLKARKTLDDIMRVENDNLESNKLLIFKKLYELIRIKHTLFDGFVNMLGTIKTRMDHKPIDILILFTLHSSLRICKPKTKIVETIFKKRVKANLINIDLLVRAFEKYFVYQIFADNFNSIIDIANCLISNKENNLLEVASAMYKMLFINKFCTRMQRQTILYNLKLLMGTDKTKNSIVMNIIKEFMEEPALKEHTLLLMGLLVMLDNLDLKDVKLLFEILCRLTCRADSDESQSALKDEINMLVKKQLACYEKTIKSRGILAAVVMAKNIVTILDDQEELDITIDCIADLPNGSCQEAACILEMVKLKLSNFPELMGLYYDQLTWMVLSSKIDKHLISWLLKTTSDDFQNKFLLETQPEPFNDFQLSSQYELNNKKEIQFYVIVNIAVLTLKPNNSILTLPSQFRLLRTLHQRMENGELSQIDALLGCGVNLPNFDDIENMNIETRKQVADCIFHCINWFRELISAFVNQKDKKLQRKVILRVMQLVELEDLLTKCMEQIPDHKLPMSYFDTVPQESKQETKIKQPAKRFKSKAFVNDTLLLPGTSQNRTPQTQNRPTQTQNKNTQAKRAATLVENNFRFREIDTDLIILLQYPLNISEVQSSQNIILHIKQFQYILKDIISKLNVLTKQKDIGLSFLNIVNPVDLIKDCERLIPKIHKQNNVIVDHLRTLLHNNDDRYEVPVMFSEEATDLKISFGLILEFYLIIFGWSGFQHYNKHHNLLLNCLKCFHETRISQGLVTIDQLIMSFINNLYSYTDQCLVLSSAVCTVELMQSLYNANPMPEVKLIIVKASEKLLKKRWFNLQGVQESGKNSFINIDKLVKGYLTEAKIKTICGLVGTLQEEIECLQTKQDYLPMLGSIDKANFHVFYRDLCTALSEQVKIEIASLSNKEHLILWRTTALTMQGLMTVSKVHETKSNLSWFLKKSIVILKVFLSHGIPILEIMLTSKPDEVLEIFKIMQTSTRFLHHLCCHSKVNKDASIINSIPQFRFTLETLVHKVKAALVANGCSQAFWMGNLRNRNLHGEDILSQSTNSNDQDNAEDEELPLESDDDDDEVPERSETPSTGSEVFD